MHHGHTRARQFLALAALLGSATVSFAQPQGVQRALIICGHPGDEEHQTAFAASIHSIRDSLVTRFGFQKQLIRLQFGQIESADSAIDDADGGASKEEIEAAVRQLVQESRPEDAAWVIVMGHAHHDGRRSFINLPGPDLQLEDFAKLFHDLPCREQIILATTPASGYVLKPIARKGRIVISATQNDLELNETLFHVSLAKVLAAITLEDQYDVDNDGRLSWFDLYIAVVRDVAQQYVDDMLISTEHALMDDNGDGRGTEVQLDYLTEELGGRADTNRARPGIRPGRDGELASQTSLPLVDVKLP